MKEPREVDISELHKYNLIGFGSGIYSDKHHKTILNLADNLPQVINKRVFIFSTSGAPGRFMDKMPGELEKKMSQDHLLLREKLQSKGYIIIDEFSCLGFNTNSFLRLLGGINKGRPNAADLKRAEEFALKLKQNLQA